MSFSTLAPSVLDPCSSLHPYTGLREFARWAPELRTVAYNGDAESRTIVEQYEMFADNGDLKSHVVITTYEALKTHARVFARCTRWDCVVIDEGQALKSGEGNKLWAGINTLHIGIKILLTGTYRYTSLDATRC